MSLPGKLCIGILEEDNPLKSYFRFKPLIVEQEGRYVPYDNHDAYPEDGCIRIVPDKNESSHFKARMRRMGLFAVVDLSTHPNENDKIRVNKNFNSDETERNAFIIYSDVVREPAAGMLYALLSMTPEQAQDAVLPPVWPAQALLRPDGCVQDSIWSYQADGENPETGRLVRSDATVNPDDLQFFDIPGFRDETLSFAVLPPDKVEAVTEPVPAKPARQPAPEPPKEPEPMPVSQEAAPEEPKEAEKPWIHHDESIVPKTFNIDPTTFRQVLAAQSGLNPRRGRSLQEIIDDKWRHSRFDQLGHPVPALASAEPVQNPVERALSVVRSLWEHIDLREGLVQAFAEIEGLEKAMDVRRAAVRDSLISQQLTELEAQRLALLADLDTLKHRKSDLREELKQEIRIDEASAFADAVKKTEQARAEQARFEKAAARAKTAAETAEDALNALRDGRFEKRLNEFAISSRAVELIQQLRGPSAAAPKVDGSSEDAQMLVDRVMECFSDAGRPIDRNDAIHLLICAAQSDFVLLSGPTGCGKSETARLLAAALGIADACYAEFAPGKESLTGCEMLPGLHGDAAAMVLLDDANLSDCTDLTRGLTPAAERGQFLCWMTLQDDGQPVPAHVFDRAFTLRLPEEAADTEWKPVSVQPQKMRGPVSREALRAAFAPQGDGIPASLVQRMDTLRAQLDLLNIRLSRRTLTALWNYCSAAIPLMQLEPNAILDRALSERALPAILAGAPLESLSAAKKLVDDLPRCKALFESSLPIRF